MGEPLSIAASILTILHISGTVVQYLSSAQDGSDDRQRIINDVLNGCGILSILKARSEGDQKYSASIKSLGLPNGPLDQYKANLGCLASKLTPKGGTRHRGKTLTWPFQKGEVKDILDSLERQKAVFALALQDDHIGLSQAIKDDVGALHVGVRDANSAIAKLQIGQKNQDDHLQDQARRDLIAWLSPLNFWSIQHTIFSRRQKGTGEWLLEAGPFKEWLSGSSKTLWCPGIPGAGKTIQASVVVNYLEHYFSQDDVGIAYIFCNYKEPQQTANNILASLLQQLVQQRSHIPDDIKRLYKSHVEMQTRPSFAECSSSLRSIVKLFSEVFIVIDALDEYLDCDGGRELLLAKLRDLSVNIRLLVTSRPIATISTYFENEARLEVRATDEDIRTYINNRIGREPRLNLYVKNDPVLRHKMTDTISGKAQGMFLLAQLHMDSLGKKHNKKEIQAALGTLPKELDRTYDEALNRICSQGQEDADLAKRVLSWISYTLEPLTVQEIQHALATCPGAVELDQSNITDESILISVCAGLVVVDQDRTMRLVHYTAQAYMERVRDTQFADARAEIAATCVTYLSLNVFAQDLCYSPEDMDNRKRDYPFLWYAVKYWSDHARGDLELKIQGLILTFLNKDLNVSSSLQAVKLIWPWVHKSFSRTIPPLSIAASLGLTHIVRAMVELGADLNAKDKKGLTALNWASANGHEAVIQLLLDANADIEATDSSGYTLLNRVILDYPKNLRILRCLLQNGAAVEAKAPYGETALHLAVMRRYVTVVELLVEYGADAMAHGVLGTPLHYAAESGNEAVIQLLLENEVDIMVKTDQGLTPLHIAVRHSKEIVIRLLLEKGADVRASDGKGLTPFHYAAEYGNEAITQLLLENGADIMAKTDCGFTPLHYAVRNKKLVIRLLLDNGADIRATNGEGLTPLHQGHEATIQLLLENGADLTARTDRGFTPLHHAVRNSKKAVIRLLLENGADIKAKTNSGYTPLHYAVRRKREAVTRLLLENGAGITAKTNSGYTPLHCAVRYKREAVIRLLLENGADVKARAAKGLTPLDIVTDSDRPSVARLLLGW